MTNKEYNGWYNYETWCFITYHSLDQFIDNLNYKFFKNKDYKKFL